MHSIEKKDGYLLVRVEGEVSFAILNGIISEVMAREDYHETNSIWDLASGFPGMKFDEFNALTASIRSRLMKGAAGRKTAIVATTGFGVEMAALWSRMAEPLLPFKIGDHVCQGPPCPYGVRTKGMPDGVLTVGDP